MTPAIQHRYDLSLAQVGVVLAAVNIGIVLTLLPWGLLADRIGERRTIGVGLAGCGAAVAGAAFAGSFGALIAFLALGGALGGCVQSARGRGAERRRDRHPADRPRGRQHRLPDRLRRGRRRGVLAARVPPRRAVSA